MMGSPILNRPPLIVLHMHLKNEIITLNQIKKCNSPKFELHFCYCGGIYGFPDGRLDKMQDIEYNIA